MSEAVTAMQEAIEKRDWGIGGPKRHEKGRPCEATLSECATAQQLKASGQEPQRGKVTMFATRIGGVLLCEPCRRKCLRYDIEPQSLTEVELLPTDGPKRTGFYLRNLRAIRKAQGLTRKEVSESAQTTPKTLDAVENLRHRPSLALINRLAFALTVNARDLRGEDSEAGAA